MDEIIKIINTKNIICNIKKIKWVMIILLALLYFDFTQSFIFLHISNGLWIKKWYLASTIVIIAIFLYKIKYFNEENTISMMIIGSSLIWFWSESNKPLLEIIKLTLLYYLPILIVYVVKEFESTDAKNLLKTILIISCIYIIINFIYIGINEIPIHITADDRVFYFYNETPWKNPFTEIEISRYTFPGMEHGMFFARIYIILFMSIILFNNNSYSYIIFSISYLAAILTASRAAFIGFYFAIFIYLILNYLRKKNDITNFILYFIALNIIFIFTLKEYILRHFVYLGGLDFIYENFKIKPLILTGLKNEYHLRNSSFSMPDKNITKNVFGILEDRPLGLFYNFISDLGLMPSLLIMSSLLYLLIKKYKNIKFSNFELFQLAILIAIITKCAFNQGENEYFIWIIIGISLIKTKYV